MAQGGILVLGAGGQVGRALQAELTRRQIPGWQALTRAEADLVDPASLRTIIRARQPQIIINAAAYTQVDRAETEVAPAMAVNAEAPALLAEEAEALGAVLVHYSTDYVFDGTGAAPYAETDATCPLSVYGRSKREGELAVMAGCRRHLLLRTSWVLGRYGHNFLRTMLRLMAERPQLRVVADQWGAPTSAELIASTTLDVLAQMGGQSADDPRWGLYHLAAAGATSWHGYAGEVWRLAAASGLPLALAAEADILPIATEDYPLPAPRPKNSRLDTGRLRSTFGLALPDWQQGVRDVFDWEMNKQ